MSPLVAGLELRVAVARRRLLVLNVVVPLLLVAPIAYGAAPPFHAAAVFTVLFVLFGTFGSAIPLVRDAESGLVGRVLRGGVAPAVYLLERTAAGTLLDCVQLLPCVLVIGLSTRADPTEAVLLVGVLAGTLWVANLVGVAVAVFARSLAETALFAAVASLLILHLSGVFRTPASGSGWAAVEASSPYRALHEATLALTSGAEGEGHVSLALWCVWLPLAVTLMAGVFSRLLRGLGRG